MSACGKTRAKPSRKLVWTTTSMAEIMAVMVVMVVSRVTQTITGAAAGAATNPNKCKIKGEIFFGFRLFYLL